MCGHAFSDPQSLTGMEKYTPEYYEEAHRKWFAHPNYNLFRWIERRLPPATRSVVDIGCGRGDFLYYLQQAHPGLRLVGIDLTENASRDGIEFHRGDFLTTDLGKFDAVISLAAIEHVANVEQFARRARALCNPGGIIVIMTLDADSIVYQVARAARALGVPTPFNRLYSAHHLHHFTPQSLKLLLERSAFEVRQSLSHNAPVKAIDSPVHNKLLRAIFYAGLMPLLVAGKLTKRCYLQTLVAVPTGSLPS